MRKGDTVRILRKMGKRGGDWIPDMDKTIGKMGKIMCQDGSSNTFLVKIREEGISYWYAEEILEVCMEGKVKWLEAMRLLKEGKTVSFQDEENSTWIINRDTLLTQPLGFYIDRMYTIINNYFESLDALNNLDKAIFKGRPVIEDGGWRYVDNRHLVESDQTFAELCNLENWERVE